MVNTAIALAILALTVAGCAAVTSQSDGEWPATAIADVSSLAGRWRGTLDETGGSLASGSTPLDITLEPDGTWKGVVGKAPAAGRSRVEDGRLVLEGTIRGPGGRPDALYYRLKGDGERRWGETVAAFGSGRASVSLERDPDR